MRLTGVIGTTALLLAGLSVPVFAQEEHHQEAAKPAQHEEQAKPQQHQEQAKPEKQEASKPAQHEEQAKPAAHEAQAKPAKQEAQAKPAQHEQQAKPAKQEAQAKPAQHEAQPKPAKQENHAAATKQQTKQVKQERHSNGGGQQHAQRTPAEEQRQRSVPALRLTTRSSARIPEERFHSNFGHDHYFRIGTPVLVGGYSRFQYGGYSFGFIEPWPVGWYYTDDVYVDYIDGGYYLYNPYYPGVRVGINVIL